MAEVVLIYPYVKPKRDNSIFRFPPLGLGYLASYLKQGGISVSIVDATFIGETKAMQEAERLRPKLIGIYSMFTMREAAIRFAKALRPGCELLIAGGPLPTITPETYLDDFDIVVLGEGEETLLEIVKGRDLRTVRGIVFRQRDGEIVKSFEKGGTLLRTAPRNPIPDLDVIPPPARELLANGNYQQYYSRRGKAPTTSLISSRGCPFECDFCSHPIFGSTFRERSPSNIVDEVEQILDLGYRRVFFQDDCFTLTKDRVMRFCDEVDRRGLSFEWECLSRVDQLDCATARRMKDAGCVQVFFGLESGSDRVLRLMKKSATAEQGQKAVEAAHSVGLKVGAFFIFGYPGEDDKSMLDTMRYASRLPIDYLGIGYPYPIPGTGLHHKLQDRLIEGNPEPMHRGLIQHQLIYHSEIPERKLRFSVIKTMIQWALRKRLGRLGPLVVRPFEYVTDHVFRLI